MSAPSPFIEGTRLQFAWDSTSLGYLKECPRKYYYTMIEGWRGRGESVHLRFGQEYHAALEHYDRLRADGYPHRESLEEVVSTALYRTWEYDHPEVCPVCGGDCSSANPPVLHCPMREGTGRPWSPDHNLKTRPNLIRSIVWYLDTFGEADPAKTVILESGAPAVELSFRFQFTDDFMLCGHLDRLVTFQGEHYVMDHKTTTSTLTPRFFEGFNPDNQMSLYTFAGQVIYNLPVKGVLITGVQIAVGFSRFERGFTYRTPEQIKEWHHDTLYHLAAAERYANSEYWPMNDKSCNNYGGCPFRTICSKDPGVRDRFLESNFVRHPWNPLEPR